MPMDYQNINLNTVPSYTKTKYQQIIEGLTNNLIANQTETESAITLINNIKYIYTYKQIHNFAKHVISIRKRFTGPRDNTRTKVDYQIETFNKYYEQQVDNWAMGPQLKAELQQEINRLIKANIVTIRYFNHYNNHINTHNVQNLHVWLKLIEHRHHIGIRKLNQLMFRLEARAHRRLTQWANQHQSNLSPEIINICAQIK